MIQWLRKLVGTADEPETLPNLSMVEADAYIGLRSTQRANVQIGVDKWHLTPKEGGAERWQPITLVDVSLGGARIVSTEGVTSGDRLRLSFKLPHGAGEFHGTGRVTWVSPTSLLAGMAFNPPANRGEEGAHERLKKYVEATKATAPAGKN